MRAALDIPSIYDLRGKVWTQQSLEQLWGQIDACASQDSKFCRDWRVNARPEYKTLREELYPFLWYLRHSDPTQEATFGLTPEGDPWDIWLQASDDKRSYFQVTLAYRATGAANPGYEYSLRLEPLNDIGRSPMFGDVRRNRKTRKVEVDPAAVERESLMAAYGDGIVAASKRKKDAKTSGGDLIIFVQDWLEAYQWNEFEAAIARFKVSPIAHSFDRIHVLADNPGCYTVLAVAPAA